MSLETAHPQKVDGKLGCPDCGNPEFRFGPAGGMSQNVECVGCETRWNATFIESIPWERLSTVWERLESASARRQLATSDELGAK